MNNINLTDTTFMFISTVLVILMTPEFALFYGVMVRKKNVLNNNGFKLCCNDYACTYFRSFMKKKLMGV